MKQIPLPPETIVDLPPPDDGTHVIAPDLAYRRLALVNVVFLGQPGAGGREWTLINAAFRITQNAPVFPPKIKLL
jgi:hypothetical protein